MVESTGSAGEGGNDTGRSEEPSGGGVSGPDQARDSMNEARSEASQSQETRDTMSGAGDVLDDVAGQVGGDNDNDRPGRGEGSMDAAQASAMGGSDNDKDNDKPGRNEGSLDAAHASAMDNDDAPGAGEGSMDAAQASAMEDTETREARESQERMEAEAKAARDSFERRAQAQQVTEQMEVRQRADAYAAELREANYTEITSNRAVDYGTTYDYYDTATIAADLMATSRTDPPMVETAYEAMVTELGPQQGSNLAAAVETLIEQERAATQTLLGDTSFEPQSLDALETQAADLLETHTSTGFLSGQASVDVESLAYEVEQLAVENPSLAVGLRSTLARSLDPVQAADLNRQIAGDRSIVERMELGAENPIDGAIGLGKGVGNIVTGTAELVADVANLADVGANNALGYGFEAAGWDEMAQGRFDAADFYGDAMAERDWAIEYDNAAQQGGGDYALAGELATGVVGIGKAGVRAGMRQLDEIGDEIVDEIPAGPTSPGGVTPGMDYTPEVVQNYPYGQLLRDRVGPPPTDMFDPHAHHIVFKKGNGAAQQQLVQDAQQILRDYDIDPIYGPEVMDWAPNAVRGQHAIDALSPVVNDLRMAQEMGLERDDIVEILSRYSNIAARRGQE